jgi:hypothetical protein
MRSKKGLHDIGRPPQKETVSDLRHTPVRAMEVLKNGQIRRLSYYNGKGLSDVRWVSGRFLLSLQQSGPLNGREGRFVLKYILCISHGDKPQHRV